MPSILNCTIVPSHSFLWSSLQSISYSHSMQFSYYSHINNCTNQMIITIIKYFILFLSGSLSAIHAHSWLLWFHRGQTLLCPLHTLLRPLQFIHSLHLLQCLVLHQLVLRHHLVLVLQLHELEEELFQSILILLLSVQLGELKWIEKKELEAKLVSIPFLIFYFEEYLIIPLKL